MLILICCVWTTVLVGHLNDFHLTLLKVKVKLWDPGIYPSILCPLNIFWTLWTISSLLQPNVPLSETVCRTHEPGLQTQGQGQLSRSWDVPLQFPVRSISPEPFERFSFYFIQMFLSMRWCAEHMIQLCSIEVNVRVQGHGIYPWSCCLLHISWTLWKFFIKLHPNVSLSETVCRSNDSATKNLKGHCHISRSWDYFTLQFSVWSYRLS